MRRTLNIKCFKFQQTWKRQPKTNENKTPTSEPLKSLYSICIFKVFNIWLIKQCKILKCLLLWFVILLQNHILFFWNATTVWKMETPADVFNTKQLQAKLLSIVFLWILKIEWICFALFTRKNIGILSGFLRDKYAQHGRESPRFS